VDKEKSETKRRLPRPKEQCGKRREDRPQQKKNDKMLKGVTDYWLCKKGGANLKPSEERVKKKRPRGKENSQPEEDGKKRPSRVSQKKGGNVPKNVIRGIQGGIIGKRIIEPIAA